MENESIKNSKRYFSIKELVSQRVYKKYGEKAWSFFDPRLLAVLCWLREGLGVPLVCNNWAAGGDLHQRGLRSNVESLVRNATLDMRTYCSAHCRGQAVDLSSPSISARDMRKWIRENISSCPYPIRIENDRSAPTWLHIDVCNTTDPSESAHYLIEFSA